MLKENQLYLFVVALSENLTEKSMINILYIEELPYLFFVKNLTLTSEIDI